MSAKTLGLLATALLAASTAAPAATIVDTGEVDAGTSQVYTFRSFRGAQFTLGEATTISTVEHWSEAFASGTGQLSIWSDVNGLPSDNGIGCSIANPVGVEATRVDGIWATGSARAGWRILSADVPEPGTLATFPMRNRSTAPIDGRGERW